MPDGSLCTVAWAPDLDDINDVWAQRRKAKAAGWQIRYSGPDSDDDRDLCPGPHRAEDTGTQA